METKEEKKDSKLGLIIAIAVIGLLLIIVIFFLLRGKNPENGGSGDNGGNDNPKQTETGEYDLRLGVLNQALDENKKPTQSDFIINGIILIGNRHNYFDTDDTSTVINSFVKQGYKTSGINSSFYLNEHIEFYIDTKYAGNDMDVKIFIVPHKKIEEYNKMSYEDINKIAMEKGTIMDYVKPNDKDHKFVNECYVNGDYPTGKYDILFMYNYKLAYFINIELSNEYE